MKDGKRGISTTGKTIFIYGVDTVSNRIGIPYHTPTNTWNTILVEWLPNKGQQGTFTINGHSKHGTFVCNDSSYSNGVYVGGGKTNPLQGSIAVFEMMIPPMLKNLIVQDQSI